MPITRTVSSGGERFAVPAMVSTRLGFGGHRARCNEDNCESLSPTRQEKNRHIFANERKATQKGGNENGLSSWMRSRERMSSDSSNKILDKQEKQYEVERRESTRCFYTTTVHRCVTLARREKYGQVGRRVGERGRSSLDPL
jgi:hypothetical protein